MSLSPSKSDQLEETLESTRRSVRKLEIEAYRIRHDLTRLEAEYAYGLANGEIDNRAPSTEQPGWRSNDDIAEQTRQAEPNHAAWDELGVRTDAALHIAESITETAPVAAHLPPIDLSSPIEIIADELGDDESATSDNDPPQEAELVNRVPPPKRRTTRPMAASLGLHSVLLLSIMSLSVASIVHEDKSFTTYIELGKNKPVEKTESLDLGQIAQLEETIFDGGAGLPSEASLVSAAKPIIEDVTPVDFESVAGPLSIGDLGAFQPNPSDLGTVLAGNGGAGADGEAAPSGTGKGNQRRGAAGGGNGGNRTGPVGSAMFFGTKSKGDRFVFVVDNSSSMKNGKLDTARSELLKTVESLSPKQSFYVIFVSDQTYPMFMLNPRS